MKGSCHCKNIQFTTKKNVSDVVNCHCIDCQKLHGNYMPFLLFVWDEVVFTSDNGLVWYDYSGKSQRGFCKRCGSRLFMKINDSQNVLISAGAFDDTSKMKVRNNIFTESKGGYYHLPELD